MKGYTSYYKILGISENASNNELRKAFCKLSKELHPDTTSLELEDAKNKFQKVLEAYENLNNPNKRKLYNEKLKKIVQKSNRDSLDVLKTIVIQANNQKLVGNRRPFSNGEMFSLCLLIIIIFMSLFFSVVTAYFTGKEIETIPTWLFR